MGDNVWETCEEKRRHDGHRNKESVTFDVDIVEIQDLADADSCEEIPSKWLNWIYLANKKTWFASFFHTFNFVNVYLNSYIGKSIEPWNFGTPSYVCEYCGAIL